MAREILFRGKRMDNGKWVEGWYCPKKTGHYEGDRFVEEVQSIIIASMTGGGYQYAVVDPRTVCQYTGLPDKNGNDIFEGDIVKGVAYSTDFIGYIVWIDAIAGFGVRYFNKHREPTAWENSSILKAIQRWKHPNEFQAEIIGNIFDNPDFLEGGAG